MQETETSENINKRLTPRKVSPLLLNRTRTLQPFVARAPIFKKVFLGVLSISSDISIVLVVIWPFSRTMNTIKKKKSWEPDWSFLSCHCHRHSSTAHKPVSPSPCAGWGVRRGTQLWPTIEPHKHHTDSHSQGSRWVRFSRLASWILPMLLTLGTLFTYCFFISHQKQSWVSHCFLSMGTSAVLAAVWLVWECGLQDVVVAGFNERWVSFHHHRDNLKLYQLLMMSWIERFIDWSQFFFPWLKLHFS